MNAQKTLEFQIMVAYIATFPNWLVSSEPHGKFFVCFWFLMTVVQILALESLLGECEGPRPMCGQAWEPLASSVFESLCWKSGSLLSKRRLQKCQWFAQQLLGAGARIWIQALMPPEHGPTAGGGGVMEKHNIDLAFTLQLKASHSWGARPHLSKMQHLLVCSNPRSRGTIGFFKKPVVGQNLVQTVSRSWVLFPQTLSMNQK